MIPPCYSSLQTPRLQSVVRDRRANWEQSIATLRAAKEFGARVTKTSIMLGCGEEQEEVHETLRLLRDNGACLEKQRNDCLARWTVVLP